MIPLSHLQDTDDGLKFLGRQFEESDGVAEPEIEGFATVIPPPIQFQDGKIPEKSGKTPFADASNNQLKKQPVETVGCDKTKDNCVEPSSSGKENDNCAKSSICSAEPAVQEAKNNEPKKRRQITFQIVSKKIKTEKDQLDHEKALMSKMRESLAQ